MRTEDDNDKNHTTESEAGACSFTCNDADGRRRWCLAFGDERVTRKRKLNVRGEETLSFVFFLHSTDCKLTCTTE